MLSMRAHPDLVEIPNMAGLIIGGPGWSSLVMVDIASGQ
jgi:hypothetical protein